MHILKKITQDEYDGSDTPTKEFLKEEVALQEDIINEFSRIASLIVEAHPENHPHQTMASILSAGTQFIIKSAYFATIPKEVVHQMCDQIIEDTYKSTKERDDLIEKVKAHIEGIAKKATKH
jgi:hypothetical protein